MQKRDKRGRFAKKKWFIILPIFGAFAIQPLLPHRIEEFKAPEVLPIVLAEEKGKTYEEKIANVKARILDDLSLGCEAKGVPEPDGIIKFDSNNEASIGRFQFQIKTVKHYVKKYEGRDITNSEAISIAIDPVKSKALAEKIIFTEDFGASRDWINCDRKLGITEKVKLIMEIETQ